MHRSAITPWSRRAAMAVLALLGVASVHCSSSTAADDDSGNLAQGLTVKRVCTDVWARRCSEWKSCLTNNFDAHFTSEADCVTQQATLCEARLTGDAVRAKPAELKACFDGDKHLTCTELTRLLFDPNADFNTTNTDPACAAITPGARKDGEACAFDAECSGGACIRSGTCGTCATKQPEGGPCKVNENCKPGLSCGSEHKCTRIQDKDQDCSVADCHTDLLCGADHKCVGRIADGDPCDPTDLNIKCSWFNGVFCDGTKKTCTPHTLGDAGDACVLDLPQFSSTVAFSGLCKPGLKCAQNSERAVCVPVTHAGEGCFFSSGPDGSQCARGAKCVDNGACVADDTAACKGFQPPPGPPTGPNPGKLPVFPNRGGPLMKKLQAVTVTFKDFPHRDHVRALGDYMFSSGWYAAAGAPFGVGDGSSLPAVELDELPPNTNGALTNLDLQDFLVKMITDGKLPKPPPFRPDQAFTYLVYLPQSLAVTSKVYGTTCKNEFAWHDVVASPFQFGYALIANCPAIGGLSEEDLLDTGGSHELLEGATDEINVSFGYILPDSSPWSFVGAEVTDVCQGSYLRSGNFLLARSWSNEEAVAGHDPCVPHLDGDKPYFNVVADSSSITAAAGSTATFTLKGWTTGARDPWNLTIRTLHAPANFAGATLSAATIEQDGTVTVSVPVPADAPHGSVIALQTRSLDPNDPTFLYHQWAMQVVVQ